MDAQELSEHWLAGAWSAGWEAATIEATAAREIEVRELREALGVIKRTAGDPWNYDGKIVELAEAALAPEPPEGA